MYLMTVYPNQHPIHAVVIAVNANLANSTAYGTQMQQCLLFAAAIDG